MSAQSQPGYDECPLASADAAPSAVAKSLTPVQRRFVLAGTIHGDFTMATVRALIAKNLFYHTPTSPNGRCGPMRLTGLGERVRAVLTKETTQ